MFVLQLNALRSEPKVYKIDVVECKEEEEVREMKVSKRKKTLEKQLLSRIIYSLFSDRFRELIIIRFVSRIDFRRREFTILCDLSFSSANFASQENVSQYD